MLIFLEHCAYEYVSYSITPVLVVFFERTYIVLMSGIGRNRTTVLDIDIASARACSNLNLNSCYPAALDGA
jgi:hypothetical protein